MLTKEQRILLNNVIDSFDRLYDNLSTGSDVHALLMATAIALRESELGDPFQDPIRRLRDLVDSDALPQQKRDAGLEATDALRQFVAEQLLQDEKENPKQRHVLPKYW